MRDFRQEIAQENLLVLAEHFNLLLDSEKKLAVKLMDRGFKNLDKDNFNELATLADDLQIKIRNSSAFAKEHKCLFCKKPILWLVTHKGKKVPIDIEPHKKGEKVYMRTKHMCHLRSCELFGKWELIVDSGYVN
jgi:predicted glutamine amidotransferase